MTITHFLKRTVAKLRSFEIAVLKNIYRVKRDGEVAAVPDVKVCDNLIDDAMMIL